MNFESAVWWNAVLCYFALNTPVIPESFKSLLNYISSHQDTLIFYLRDKMYSANFPQANLHQTNGQNRTSPTPAARTHRHH
jgi:hypothetical protein